MALCKLQEQKCKIIKFAFTWHTTEHKNERIEKKCEVTFKLQRAVNKQLFDREVKECEYQKCTASFCHARWKLDLKLITTIEVHSQNDTKNAV